MLVCLFAQVLPLTLKQKTDGFTLNNANKLAFTVLPNLPH